MMQINPIVVDDSGDKPVITRQETEGAVLLAGLLTDLQQFRDDFPTLTDPQKWNRLNDILHKIIRGMVWSHVQNSK